jgi:hypothetical protein
VDDIRLRVPRKRRAEQIAGVLIAAGLAAGCSSSGSSGSGKSSAPSCTIDDSPTRDGDTYKITLKVPHSEDGYFSRTASVTTSGGLDAPSPSSEPLNTAIPITLGPGTYFVRATIAPSSNAPSGVAAVSCSMDLYVN